MLDFSQEIALIGVVCWTVGLLFGFLIERVIVNKKFAILFNEVKFLRESIMTTLDEFIAAQTAFNATLDAALVGVTGDVTKLNEQIATLQGATGSLTPAQQTALDALTASGAALAERADALDTLTPPAPPVA